MAKPKLLGDDFFSEQLERLSGLAGFPAMPAAQADLKNAMRRVSQIDKEFLHRLISEFVDDPVGKCPKPGELLQLAGQWRAKARGPMGNPGCPNCHGTGWICVTRMVRVAGMEPYEADSSQRCSCVAVTV